MVSNLSGVALVLAIVIVAGVIAYIGDRVGHQVGRKRLTLFGLRPKYTSTIVAVATGMLIALSVTLAALVGSAQVRTAFFRLSQLNGRINDLQAQAIGMQQQLETTRSKAFVLPLGFPIANVAATIRPSQPDTVLLPELSSLFDQTVTQANRQFARAPYGLRPYALKASDPSVQSGLRASWARSGPTSRGCPRTRRCSCCRWWARTCSAATRSRSRSRTTWTSAWRPRATCWRPRTSKAGRT